MIPNPTTLQEGWFWIRAVATPHYRSYLQAAALPTTTTSENTKIPAIIAPGAGGRAGQFKVVGGQLVMNCSTNGNNESWYMDVENPSDKSQRKLRTWFEIGDGGNGNGYGAFGFQGDTLTWSVGEIRRPNEAAWLVCGDEGGLFVNTGAFLYDTPEGCWDHTVSFSPLLTPPPFSFSIFFSCFFGLFLVGSWVLLFFPDLTPYLLFLLFLIFFSLSFLFSCLFNPFLVFALLFLSFLSMFIITP
jgi:hypothetical protein